MECYRESKECMKEGDAIMERMIAKCGNRKDKDEEELQWEEEEGMQLQPDAGKSEFMKEVMEAVRLTRQPSPRMVQREKLVRMLKRDMERANTRPGSFVAESLRYNQNLARAYLRFGLQTCPPKEELAMRENRILRRKMMMLSQEE